MKKILSIIIPVYNVEKYLNRCLDSILTDRFDEFEVILIDDGSTDGSGIICEEYCKKYNNVLLFHKENGGASDARNFGTQKANGKYIWYIDSDDYISNNSISDVIDLLMKNDCDVMVCQSKKVYENNKIVDECNYSIRTGMYSSNEFMETMRNNPKSIIFCPQYYIVNSDFVKENKIFFHKGIIYEDELWIPQLILNAKRIYYSGLNNYFHFMRNESVMHSTKLEKMRL